MTLDGDCAVSRRNTDLSVCDTCILKNLLRTWSVSISNLNNDTWVLCEEHLNDVVALDLVEVESKTALSVGEAHLKQGCDETTGRDVVTCEDETLVYELLNSDECIAEVLGILNGWNIRTNLALTLSECRTAKLKLVE